VIRKDMPVPFIDKTVVNEFGPLQHLHALGFPVAKALWLEDDAAVFGGRFIVSERVPGSSNSAAWAADPARARSACRELAQILAKLHAFSPQQLGYSKELAALSAGEMIKRDIEHWTRLFHAKKTEPLPLQELPLVWLRRNIPKQLYDRPARIVHGDFGFHNVMFNDDGHVSALLDWEFSVLGDPTQDICFVRLFVEPIMPWSEFLDIYLKMGGVPPCTEAEFFFDMWSKTRNSVGCVDAQFLFDTALPDEVKFALAGHVFAPYLYIDECESVIRHVKKGHAGR
jgi:aminoglycoside phosphotransferase (APT) family kinase protein